MQHTVGLYFILSMKRILSTLALAAGFFGADAQQLRPANSGFIYHEIAQLNNLANVLYFAAHPDDENTRLLAWMVNDRHIRTAYLSLTRGDGGQNILGSEQGSALGLIRTYELLEARKLDGAGQYFTRAVDFGFSKTYQETFKHWDSTKLIQDAVRIIREFRPDVIVCRFPPNTQAGHGHHAASAIIAEAAFRTAGDKTKFPDQLVNGKAWQPKRILFNAFRFGSSNTTTEDMFKLEVGNYSPLLGMGYGELAGISRSIHRSQGAGTPSTPGVQKEYFKLVAGAPIDSSLFSGIDITWNRVDRPEIGERITEILNTYDFKRPEASLPALLELKKEIATVKNTYWREQKTKELNDIILHCAGLMAEVFTKQPEAVAGDTLAVTMNIISRADIPVRIKGINRISSDTITNIKLKKDSLYSFNYNITLPDSTPYTEPYWLAIPQKESAHFELPGDEVLSYPVSPSANNVIVSVKIGSELFDVNVPLSYKKLDPTHGDVVEQLRIVPPFSIEFTSGLVFMKPDTSIEAQIRIHPFKDINGAILFINAYPNSSVYKIIKGINLKKNIDTTIEVTFDKRSITRLTGEDMYLTTSMTSDEGDFSRTRHIIKYEHLPTLQYFSNAYTKVLQSNWKCAAKRVGYIPGAGDNVAQVLEAAGVKIDILKPSEVTVKNLKKYDAILTGVRIVNTERNMPTMMHQLLQYVNEGGTLVMQYNTMQDMATTQIGPYNLTLSRSRVTEEDAKITVLDPKHKIMNYPNKITDADFEGWVQERGLYFPGKWDDRYKPLFSMHDMGEEALTGATLHTQYGKGHYIYTSLAFFRQIPSGNKGAIRLMMNMLSVGEPEGKK